MGKIEKPINFLEKLCKELGIEPTEKNIREYNQFISGLIKTIPGNYVAFDLQDNIVSWGYTLEETEDHAASKGVLTPITLHASLLRKYHHEGDKPIKIYPNAKSWPI